MFIPTHVLTGLTTVLGTGVTVFGLHQFVTGDFKAGDEYLVSVVPNHAPTARTTVTVAAKAAAPTTLTTPTKGLVTHTGDINDEPIKNYACASMVNQEYVYDESCTISPFLFDNTASLSSVHLATTTRPVNDASQFKLKNLFTIKSKSNSLKRPHDIYVVPKHEIGTTTTITQSYAKLNVMAEFSRKTFANMVFSGKYNFILGTFAVVQGSSKTIAANSTFTCKRDFDSTYKPCDLYTIPTQPEDITSYLTTNWNQATKFSSTTETLAPKKLYIIHLKHKYWIRDKQPRGGLFQVKITSKTPPPPTSSPSIEQFISISTAIGEVVSDKPKLFILS